MIDLSADLRISLIAVSLKPTLFQNLQRHFHVIMSKLDDVVDELFGSFKLQFPLANRATISKKVVDQRLDRFYAEAHLVRKKHRLWLLNWARVVMQFQQRLLQAGYPPDGVKPLLLGMIIFSYNAK